MSRYRQFITYANYTAFLALLCAMPYPMPFIRFFGLVWIISWLLEVRFLQRPNTSRSNIFVAAGFTVWFVWNLISVAWAHNTAAAWSCIQRDLYILAIPLVMLWGVNERYNWQQIVKVMFISSLVSVFVYLFTHFWLMNSAAAWDRLTPRNYSIDWLHPDDFLHGIKHRLHYTSFLTLTIAAGLLQFTSTIQTSSNHSNFFKPFKHIAPYAIGTVVLIAACIWTGSRAALVNIGLLIALTSLYIWTNAPLLKGLPPRPKWQRITAAAVVAALILAAFLLMLRFHPRQLGLSIHEQFTVHEDNQYAPTIEPRIAIWHTALETPQDYSLHGLGVGNSTDYIINKYIDHNYSYYLSSHYSVHNQFLATWMELGLLAAILWLLFWLALPLVFTGQQRFWVALACAICFVALATDLFLAGVEGIAFTIIVFTLLAVLQQKKHP